MYGNGNVVSGSKNRIYVFCMFICYNKKLEEITVLSEATEKIISFHVMSL